VYGGGDITFNLQSADNQVAYRALAASNGVYHDTIREDGTGAQTTSAGFSTFFRNSDSLGTLRTSLLIYPNGLIQVGNNAYAIPGAITSTFKYFGAYSGAIDLTQYQTAGLAPGSTVSSLVISAGQIGRIWVTGGGSIVLPAAIKLPRGGAVWGNVYTMLSFFTDGGVILASFVPYD
jgi:hypothetical protein